MDCTGYYLQKFTFLVWGLQGSYLQNVFIAYLYGFKVSILEKEFFISWCCKVITCIAIIGHKILFHYIVIILINNNSTLSNFTIDR